MTAVWQVILDPTLNGTLSLTPTLPEDGWVPDGTTVTVTASPASGYSLDSIYYSVPGRWGTMYHESLTTEFQIVIDQDKHIGASFIAKQEVAHLQTIHNVIYAQPGVKALKYDVYRPLQAQGLPIVVVIHGGAWSTNDEDIMRGLARELTRNKSLVVCCIDYRWLGQLDGDVVPNKLNDLIEDVFGALAHIQEHAGEYGGDPSRIGLTGDSAGGHLSAAAALFVERIGDRGFGKQAGIFEFLPSYLPADKTLSTIRQELLSAIRAVAPSYGVFSVDGLKDFQLGVDDESAKANAPREGVVDSLQRPIPVFLNRGSEDELISAEEVETFAEELKRNGHPVVYEEIAGAEHAFFDWKPREDVKETFQKYGVPAAGRMRAFFEQAL